MGPERAPSHGRLLGGSVPLFLPDRELAKSGGLQFGKGLTTPAGVFGQVDERAPLTWGATTESAPVSITVFVNDMPLDSPRPCPLFGGPDRTESHPPRDAPDPTDKGITLCSDRHIDGRSQPKNPFHDAIMPSRRLGISMIGWVRL